MLRGHDDALAVRVAAIREAFEECGALLARKGGALIGGAEAAEIGVRWRDRLEAREATMRDAAEAEGMRLALDLLTPFARWVTPPVMPMPLRIALLRRRRRQPDFDPLRANERPR